MTAREFIKAYSEVLKIPEEMMLHLLDCYLVGIATVRYSVFPDADLPGEFIEADEPASFEDWLDEKLWP